MNEFVWLVCMGWDCHDCSPSLYGVFSTLELAQGFARELRDNNESRHVKNYGSDGGTHEWKSLTSSEEVPLPSSYEEYWQSYVTFGSVLESEGINFCEDDVIYIQKVPINVKNFCDWAQATEARRLRSVRKAQSNPSSHARSTRAAKSRTR